MSRCFYCHGRKIVYNPKGDVDMEACPACDGSGVQADRADR